MYKTASQSRASQSHIATRREDVGPAPWLVVAMRVGHDNQGRERVYRIIRGERTRDKAHELSAMLTITHGFVAVIDGASGHVFSYRGNPRLVLRWHRSRRQANRGANWRIASTYTRRAGPGRDVDAAEEFRKRSHEEMEEILDAMTTRREP